MSSTKFCISVAENPKHFIDASVGCDPNIPSGITITTTVWKKQQEGDKLCPEHRKTQLQREAVPQLDPGAVQDAGPEHPTPGTHWARRTWKQGF